MTGNTGKVKTVKLDLTRTTARSEYSADVVIVGGGAAGGSVAASLRKRDENIRISIIDPADVHYYQPGWTMVGGGVFSAEDTVRTMASCIPEY